MRSFLYNYANGINIINGEQVYIDALQNFTYDCSTASLGLIKPMSDDVYEFFAIDNGNPKNSYAKTRQFGQVGFEFTGHKPGDYFIYIDNIQKLIEAKRRRSLNE